MTNDTGIARWCPECGEFFTVEWAGDRTLYCSMACRAAARKRKNAERKFKEECMRPAALPILEDMDPWASGALDTWEGRQPDPGYGF